MKLAEMSNIRKSVRLINRVCLMVFSIIGAAVATPALSAEADFKGFAPPESIPGHELFEMVEIPESHKGFGKFRCFRLSSSSLTSGGSLMLENDLSLDPADSELPDVMVWWRKPPEDEIKSVEKTVDSFFAKRPSQIFINRFRAQCDNELNLVSKYWILTDGKDEPSWIQHEKSADLRYPYGDQSGSLTSDPRKIVEASGSFHGISWKIICKTETAEQVYAADSLITSILRQMFNAEMSGMTDETWSKWLVKPGDRMVITKPTIFGKIKTELPPMTLEKQGLEKK